MNENVKFCPCCEEIIQTIVYYDEYYNSWSNIGYMIEHNITDNKYYLIVHYDEELLDNTIYNTI